MDKEIEKQIFSQQLAPYEPSPPRPPGNNNGPPERLFACTDCGDKFVFEPSLIQHLSRRSVCISIWQPDSEEPLEFYNRCNLLAHLRSLLGTTRLQARIAVKPLRRDQMRLFADEMDSESGETPTSNGENNSTDITAENEKGNEMAPAEVSASESEVALRESPERAPTPVATSNSGSFESMSIVMSPSQPLSLNKCPECNLKLNDGMDLKQHFKNGAAKLPCGTCKIPLLSACQLKCHERIHSPYYKQRSSFICPECGLEYLDWDIFLDHLHSDCMHAYLQVSYQCQRCLGLFSSALSLEVHILKAHIRKIYKCSNCTAACYTPQALHKHRMENHSTSEGRASVYQMCEFCPGPGRMVTQSVLLFHVHEHAEDPLREVLRYFCEPCDVYEEVRDNFKGHKQLCKNKVSKFTSLSNLQAKQTTSKIPKNETTTSSNPRSLLIGEKKFGVKESFSVISTHSETILPSKITVIGAMQAVNIEKKASPPAVSKTKSVKRKQMEDINSSKAKNKKCIKNLPKTCHKCGSAMLPYRKKMVACYKCNRSLLKTLKESEIEELITIHGLDVNYNGIKGKAKLFKCPHCQQQVSDDKAAIQDHIESRHKELGDACLLQDGLAELKKWLAETVASKQFNFKCRVCALQTDDEEDFRDHIVGHRPEEGIQCMECGMCYVVRPSLEKHLLLIHRIRNVAAYLRETGQERDDDPDMPGPPLEENQCNVCRAQFETGKDLNSHMRSHGLAFLLRSTEKNSDEGE